MNAPFLKGVTLFHLIATSYRGSSTFKSSSLLATRLYVRIWDLYDVDGNRLSGVPSLGVPGVPWHTQILADQLTLSQLGGTDYAHLITTGTPGFSDLPTALYTVCSRMD